MQNRGLIFIPDISGFTRFVNETEIDHSRYIIQELLELLINANQLGLEISEIEGDAILFYKYGDAPALEEICSQVEKMFCAFHRHLSAYEKRRICQCAACKSAIDLTLKVITHYGEFTGYNVKNFSKLIGKDIILAHQLLKNDIEQHEYWLVTDGLMQSPTTSNLPAWINWSSSAKSIETGQVHFQYTQLGSLRDNLAPDVPPKLEITNKVKVLSVSRDIDAEINTVFYTALDFNGRARWQHGVKEIADVSDMLPQIGTHHRCVLERGQVNMYTSSYSYSPEKIEYAETDDKKKSSGCYIFENKGVNKTKATFDLYLKNDFVMVTLFRLFMKKKLERSMMQSLDNLSKIITEDRAPAAV